MVEIRVVSDSNRTASGLDPVSRERMDAISELVRRISHEYNNLFGIIIATLGIIKEDIDEHPGISQLKPLISDALSASKEGTELLERLLACTGHHLLQPEAVDVARLMEETRRRLQPVLPDNIDFELETDAELPRAFVDPAALEVALHGLMENAREAMPAGGTLRVSAALYDKAAAGNAVASQLSPGRFLSITVSDTGKGIEPALLGRVIEPFFTTKEPAKGRGFGLSRSYGFARQSGGRLLLESGAATGTRVTLVVPAAASQPE